MTITIQLIGGATALMVCATAIKLFATGPAKANKAEKAEIMKQLLALSETENRTPRKPIPAQSHTPLPKPAARRGTNVRPPSPKLSQAVRAGK